MAHHEELLYTLPDSAKIDAGLWGKVQSFLLGFGALSIIGAIAGYLLDPKQFFFSYLVAFCFFTFLSLGALFFVSLQHLGSATWSVTVRRLAEQAAATMPLSAVLAIPLVLGIHTLYEWSHAEAVAHDHILQAKAPWLNEPFFIARIFFYIAVWSFLAIRLYRASVKQDEHRTPERVVSMKHTSAAALVLTIVLGTLAAYDWLMSLTPHWYSTMFGVYTVAGGGIAFISTLILVCLGLRKAGVLAHSITIEHYHDLGKLLFAFTVFWAYSAFSQYMLIWYGNMPEETIWFLPRTRGGWYGVFLVLVFGHFLVPFGGLMARWAKRNLSLLGAAAVWMLVMEFIDLHWVVMPVLNPEGIRVSWIDLACWGAVGSLYGLYFWSFAKRRDLAPVGDYKLPEALNFKNI